VNTSPLTCAGRCLVAVLLLTLTGCAGGSGNGGQCGGCENPYGVSGSVTGLAGSGLVLRDNGTDDLSISADGPFTFATRLATSVSYSVSVYAQPTNPSQTCVVTNGVGGWSSSTTPTVTCTTDLHTIGGVVTGLTGTGLVLRNNGGDDQSISKAGAFAFPIAVASGAPYSVTVSSNPLAPPQTCTVMNGSGLVATTDITNVTVDCVTPPPPVSVFPTNVNVAAGATQQFIATVTGLTSTAVTWNVNGIAGGNSALGTVSDTGLYLAPMAATTVTIMAVAQSDPSKSATASLVVLAPHRIAVRTGTDGRKYFYCPR
jgi:hypothetical protein